MSKRYSFLIWGVLFFYLLSACNETTDPTITNDALNDQEILDYIQAQGLDADSTGSGLFYINNTSTNGDLPQKGDSVYIHYQATLLSGVVVDSTSPALDRPDGFLMEVTPLISGLEEGIFLMKEGENTTFLVPSYLAYGGNPPAALIALPPFSVLSYTVDLIDVLSEREQVNNFFQEENYVPTQVLGDSLYFRLDQAGSPNTKLSDEEDANVVYSGRFLSGSEFDSNQDSSFTFTLGNDEVVTGFEEAIKLMNQGDKATVVFLSPLGYDTTGFPPSIPPYAPLLFELNLVKSNATQIAEFWQSQGSPGDTLSTESGVIYRRLVTGNGTSPNSNSIVTLTNYSSTYLDSLNQEIPFDVGSTTRTFNLAANSDDEPSLNTGLAEAIIQLNVGDEVIVIMEFAEGFGTLGRLDAPGRVPLVYRFRLDATN